MADEYLNQIALRIRGLRKQKKWSQAEVRDRIKQVSGLNVAESTLYAYERPSRSKDKQATGYAFPTELIPVIAKIYGFKTATGWLPKEI